MPMRKVLLWSRNQHIVLRRIASLASITRIAVVARVAIRVATRAGISIRDIIMKMRRQLRRSLIRRCRVVVKRMKIAKAVITMPVATEVLVISAVIIAEAGIIMARNATTRRIRHKRLFEDEVLAFA